MKNSMLAIFATSLFSTATVLGAPNPEAKEVTPAPIQLQVTIHKLENGEKKSSQSITALNGGSASTLTITNNKTYERNFYTPELKEDGKVLVHMHQCSGTISAEQLSNVSSVNCIPETMNRQKFEASLSKATIVEATGPNGEKQEYYIFVEKVGELNNTTL